MEIRCEKCSVTYELDPVVLPQEGAAVQCTRCRHVFHAMPPKERRPEPGDLVETAMWNGLQDAGPTLSFEAVRPTRSETARQGGGPFMSLGSGGGMAVVSQQLPARRQTRRTNVVRDARGLASPPTNRAVTPALPPRPMPRPQARTMQMSAPGPAEATAAELEEAKNARVPDAIEAQVGEVHWPALLAVLAAAVAALIFL